MRGRVKNVGHAGGVLGGQGRDCAQGKNAVGGHGLDVCLDTGASAGITSGNGQCCSHGDNFLSFLYTARFYKAVQGGAPGVPLGEAFLQQQGSASSTTCGGVKTPPYDAKDKGDTMAKLRVGHARPLRTTVNGSRTKGARGWLPLPFSPTKTKKRDGHCPVSFFLKKKEKNRTSRRRLNANGTTPLQVIPSLRIRQGALVFFLFSCRSEALAFDVLIVHYFCRICKMRTCTTCYICPTLFCIVCTIVHG